MDAARRTDRCNCEHGQPAGPGASPTARPRGRTLSVARCARVADSGCASRPGKPPAGEAMAGRGPPGLGRPSGGITVRVGAKGGSRIVTLPLDEYVLGPCAPSPAVDAARRTRKPGPRRAGHVSRTYAVANLGRHTADGYDLCDTTHCRSTGLRHRARAGRRRSAGRQRHARQDRDVPGKTDPGALPCGLRRTHGVGCLGMGAPMRRISSRWRTGSAAGARLDLDVRRRGKRPDPRVERGCPDPDRRSVRRIEIASRDPSGRALAVTLIGSTTVSVRAEVFRAS